MLFKPECELTGRSEGFRPLSRNIYWCQWHDTKPTFEHSSHSHAEAPSKPNSSPHNRHWLVPLPSTFFFMLSNRSTKYLNTMTQLSLHPILETIINIISKNDTFKWLQTKQPLLILGSWHIRPPSAHDNVSFKKRQKCTIQKRIHQGRNTYWICLQKCNQRTLAYPTILLRNFY